MSRQWKFVYDMNGDGLITISDVWAWVGWLFYYPGDLVIYWTLSVEELAHRIKQFSTFFEVLPPSHGGWVSMLISLVFWLSVLLASGKVLDWYDRLYAQVDEYFVRKRQSKQGKEGKE